MDALQIAQGAVQLAITNRATVAEHVVQSR
jgi:hypothetical protein